MKILIAPDKFRGSISAKEAARAVDAGLSSFEVACMHVPLADGGEGTAKILTDQSQGQVVTLMAEDPLKRMVKASYGISKDGSTAFIETANASGLWRLAEHERNPMNTSSTGTGQLIADAIRRGVRHIVLGIGGTATNDGGMGLAHALGVRFRGTGGEVLEPRGRNLSAVTTIDTTNVPVTLRDIQLTVLCDVTNSLYGEKGAAYLFAAQKGASKDEIAFLDKGLKHFADVLQQHTGVAPDFPGAGAGGGLGASLKCFTKANFRSGIEFVIETTNLEHHIAEADLVITGEGKLDEQTLQGKAVAGVCQLCVKHKKPLVVITGECELDEARYQSVGIRKVITLTSTGIPLSECMLLPFEAIRICVERNFPFF